MTANRPPAPAQAGVSNCTAGHQAGEQVLARLLAMITAGLVKCPDPARRRCFSMIIRAIIRRRIQKEDIRESP